MDEKTDRVISRQDYIRDLMMRGHFDQAHAEAEADKLESETEAVKKHMSPPEALNLPALLEKRRLDFHITDGAFGTQAIYDRVFVWQVPEFEERYGADSRIIMSTVGQRRERESVPRGVLVSAGPAALDAVRSNGVDLGHIVKFIALAPMRLRYALIEAKEHYLIVLGAADIVGSEDLAEDMKTGEKTIALDECCLWHHIVRKDGSAWFGRPQNPRSLGEE